MIFIKAIQDLKAQADKQPGLQQQNNRTLMNQEMSQQGNKKKNKQKEIQQASESKTATPKAPVIIQVPDIKEVTQPFRETQSVPYIKPAGFIIMGTDKEINNETK